MGERTRELALLILGDVGFIIVALWLTLLVRYVSIPSWELFAEHLGPFLILSTVWLFIFYIGGLYDKHTVFLKSLLFTRILKVVAFYSYFEYATRQWNNCGFFVFDYPFWNCTKDKFGHLFGFLSVVTYLVENVSFATL
jgi:hypothetical protein